jgi:hypothetical protein
LLSNRCSGLSTKDFIGCYSWDWSTLALTGFERHKSSDTCSEAFGEHVHQREAYSKEQQSELVNQSRPYTSWMSCRILPSPLAGGGHEFSWRLNSSAF